MPTIEEVQEVMSYCYDLDLPDANTEDIYRSALDAVIEKIRGR